MRPLRVALVWHMHQPYYRDAPTGEYSLPWARLHAAKDYVHMAELVAEFPRLRVTFNYVPSLTEQLSDYARGAAADAWMRVCLKPELDEADKHFLARYFFAIDAERFIDPRPRYRKLRQLRDQLEGEVELLSEQYWLDLMVWFNLSWIDPEELRRDRTLDLLVRKEKGFDRSDLALVLQKHRESCGRVVPLHRALQDASQIEVSTTPYFHPIMPLLIDTEAARAASPDLPLPVRRFHYADDARTQLELARRHYQATFGRPARGLWPSEGAVGDEVAALVAADGWSWMASDEAILARSLGLQFRRDAAGYLAHAPDLYQPYRYQETGLALLFRDRDLSDRIGFVYKRVPAVEAAGDLLGRLRRIADALADDARPYVVPIILDGENCWEEYENNGSDFLRLLYHGLTEDAAFRTVTISEHLAECPPRRHLPALATGSWIYGNLETWIGEPEQNRAWELLGRTRDHLAAWLAAHPDAPADAAARAWHDVRVAEGSDWFWWYYSQNQFGQEHLFDADFRRHLGNVYRAIGEEPPLWLGESILTEPPERARDVTGHVDPTAGESGWSPGGLVESPRSTGAMQRGAGVLRRLRYGHDRDNLWLRLEGQQSLDGRAVALYLAARRAEGSASVVEGLGEESGEDPALRYAWRVDLSPADAGFDVYRAADAGWARLGQPGQARWGDRWAEVALSRAALGLEPGEPIAVRVLAIGEDGTPELLPHHGQARWELRDY